MSYKNITYINNGDAVSAAVANTPIYQLKKETEQLQDKFDTTEAGNTLIFRDIPCDSSVLVGMPVYWDTDSQQCKAAYIQAELNETTKEYISSKSSDCIGLVYRKNSAYSADILVSGLLSFPAVSEALGGNTGKFYLGITPGSLTCNAISHAFPLGVALGPLGKCDDQYWIYFNPCFTNNVFQHQHFSVDLVCQVVESLDQEGWIHLAGTDIEAPTGAKYMYNMANGELAKLWAPIPITAISATVDWAFPGESVGGKELTINKEHSLLKITENGIYWMSEYLIPVEGGPSEPEVPVDFVKEFRLTLHFSKIRYANRLEFVTNLRPYDNHPFKFVNCKGEEASSGDLYAQFTLQDDPITGTNYDGLSLRRFTDDWKSELLPSVHGIHLSGNGSITHDDNTHTYTVNENGVNVEYASGNLKLNLSPYAANTEISPQIIKVGAAQEREYMGITYLGLPYGRDSSLRLKFEIPSNYCSGNCTFKLRMQCLASSGGMYAQANITYLKLPRGNSNLSDLHEYDITGATFGNVVAQSSFEVESNPITVTPGDTLVIIISRPKELSDYKADLAIARINGILNVA